MTDLLCNTLGVCCGLLFYCLMVNWLKDRIMVWVNSLGLIVVGLPTLELIIVVIIGLLT